MFNSYSEDVIYTSLLYRDEFAMRVFGAFLNMVVTPQMLDNEFSFFAEYYTDEEWAAIKERAQKEFEEKNNDVK